VIKCINCNNMNESTQTECNKCGETLLPGRSRKERVINLAKSIVALVLSVILSILSMPSQEITQTNNVTGKTYMGGETCCSCIVVLLFIVFIYYFWQAIRPIPLHEKYAMRAERQVDIDKEQAEKDYGNAIAISAKNISYRYKRGILFENNGKLKEALTDYQEAQKLEMSQKYACRIQPRSATP
jgi:tetratricopeptide (TPR) repeat protein